MHYFILNYSPFNFSLFFELFFHFEAEAVLVDEICALFHYSLVEGIHDHPLVLRSLLVSFSHFVELLNHLFMLLLLEVALQLELRLLFSQRLFLLADATEEGLFAVIEGRGRLIRPRPPMQSSASTYCKIIINWWVTLHDFFRKDLPRAFFIVLFFLT